MAQNLSKEELEGFKAAFEALDKNKDGVITTEELGEVMRSLGQDPSTSELQDLINELDADHSGAVDFDEFLKMMSSKATHFDTQTELRNAFAVFDRDGSGTIDASEIGNVLKAMGEDLTDGDIEEMISQADVDKNGTIDFDEFVKFMEKL